mgnify:FL=1
MNIRKVRTSDVKGIAECVQSAYYHYIDRIGSKPAPMLADYNKYVENNNSYVIEEERFGIAGVLNLVIFRNTFLLENIAVHKSAQGKGYGRMLLKLAEETAKSHKFEVINLYTHYKMKENIILYQRIGYEIFDRIRENGYDRIYMRKELKD